MSEQVHNQLRRGFLSTALTRAVGDNRGDAGLERFGETLQPVIDLWGQPEWNYLRKDFLVSAWRTSAAVAGEYSGIAICNPAGSGALAVIERAGMWGGAVGSAFYASRATVAIIAATFAGTGGRGVSRDSRFPYNISPGFCDIYIGSDAALFGTPIGVTPVGNANALTELIGLPYVISPGEGLAFLHNTVNVAAWLSVVYRERKALPGELE